MSPRRCGEGILPLFRSTRHHRPGTQTASSWVGRPRPTYLLSPRRGLGSMAHRDPPLKRQAAIGRPCGTGEDGRTVGDAHAPSDHACPPPGGSAPGRPGFFAFRQQHGNHGRTRAACRDADSRIKGRDIFLLSCHWPRLVPAQAGSEGLPGVWGQRYPCARLKYVRRPRNPDQACLPFVACSSALDGRRQEPLRKGHSRLPNGEAILHGGLRGGYVSLGRCRAGETSAQHPRQVEEEE
jgi:hypothetical protein